MNWLECTLHCHTNLCDGKNTPEEMVKAAIKQGVKVLGLSGHSHTPHDDSYCMTQENTAFYRNEIARLNREYGDKLTILCGLEWDLWSDENMSDWDYTVGSAHYVTGPSGVIHSVDHNMESFRTALADFGGDGIAMAETYFAAVAQVAAKGPTILGHFDLVKKLNGSGAFFDETHPRYRAAALSALEAAAGKVQAMEINTGGVARGYRKDFYPAPFLMKQWKELGGEVVLTADAHTTGNLLFAFAEAAEYAKSFGFTRAMVLNAAGKPEFVSLTQD